MWAVKVQAGSLGEDGGGVEGGGRGHALGSL